MNPTVIKPGTKQAPIQLGPEARLLLTKLLNGIKNNITQQVHKKDITNISDVELIHIANMTGATFIKPGSYSINDCRKAMKVAEDIHESINEYDTDDDHEPSPDHWQGLRRYVKKNTSEICSLDI